MDDNNINIENIESKWLEVKSSYNDMYERLSFISSKNVNHKLSEKMYVLMLDMENIVNDMEKICSSVDDIYAKKGKINKLSSKPSKKVNIIVANSNL